MFSELQDKSPEERIQFIFQAQNETSDQRLDRVSYLLKRDPSPIVRHEAAYVLGEIQSPKSYELLEDAIKHDENKFVVHEAALAMGNLGNPQGKHILISLLDHQDKDIVLTAKIAIERLEMKIKGERVMYKDAKDVILDLDSHPEHRIQSSFLLMEEGSEDSLDILIKALKQEIDPIVKHEIIFALGETASKIASASLIDEIGLDPNHFVVHESLLALSTLGFRESEPIIRKYLDNDILEIKESAEIALDRLLGGI